jgi:hypothetical protein
MAKRQGALLYELEPDLVLLQEVNPAQRRCCAGQPVPTGSFGLSICVLPCQMTGRCCLAVLRSRGATHHPAMPGYSPMRRCPSARYL